MFSIRRYDWTFHLVTIAICAYFLAQALSTYVTSLLETSAAPAPSASVPVTPSVSPAPGTLEEKIEQGLEEYQVIAERNIFNSAESGVLTPGAQQNIPPDQSGELGPAVKSGLDVKLLGTLVIGEGKDRRSSATVASKGGKGADVFYPGDEKSFEPGVKLITVARDRIEFIHNGRLEFIEMEDFAAKKSVFASVEEVHGKGTGDLAPQGKGPSSPVASSGESSRITVDQREIDEALQNLDKLMTEIRIVPNFREGQPDGMKVLSIKPGSMVSKLGLKRGDILQKVNGQPLDIRQGMELFSQMKDMKTFALDVVRGGKNQTLEYEIK